jgi:hypothetical protein
LDLRETLKLRDTKIIQTPLYPLAENGLKAVMVLRSRLTAELAESLQCAYLFTENGVPRPHFTSHPLDHKITAADVKFIFADKIEQFDIAMIHKFGIKRVDDDVLEMEFRVHFNSNFHELIDLMMQIGKSDFTFNIQSKQGSLFSSDDSTQPVENGAADSDNDSDDDGNDPEPIDDDDDEPEDFDSLTPGAIADIRDMREREPETVLD